MKKDKLRKVYKGYLDWDSELPKGKVDPKTITFGSTPWFNDDPKAYETKVRIIVEEL